MKTLRDKIYEVVSSNETILTMVPSGIHVDIAPSGLEETYLVIHVGGLVENIEDTGPIHIEKRNVMFKVFGSNSNTVAKTLKIIEFEMLRMNLNMPVAQSITAVYKESDDLFLEEDRNELGNEVWQGILVLEVWNEQDKDVLPV